MTEETFRALYIPRNIDMLSSKMLEYSGKEYQFRFIYEIDGQKYYESADKNFSESRPIPREDLRIDEQ